MSGNPVAPGNAGPDILQVGSWTVDRMLNQLRRGEERVRLEPKAMELLVHLAERPGEVWSREALLEAVWPGVVVGDDALTQAVIKLRRALGDTAAGPAYIETIPKRGYRLVAAVVAAPRVRVADAASATPADASPAAAPRAGRRRAASRAALALLALACIAGLAWLVAGRVTRDAALPDVQSNLATDLQRLAAQPAVLVAPLEVLGHDPRLGILARGLTADLTTDLANTPGLTVLAGPAPGGAAAARVPGEAPIAARYIVSGSVQRDARRLRVNLRLADAQSGAHLWSERFERPAGDLFAVQDELATRIVSVLPLRLTEAERGRIARRYTRSLEAYELFHRAQLAVGAREPQQNAAARELYWRAIALDPAFARAYAGAALTHALDYRHRWARDLREALDKARELAQSARHMAPDNVETLWVLAYVEWHRREYAQALGVLKEALRVNPSFADAYGLMGDILTDLGRPREGVELLRAGMRLTPSPGAIYYLLLGRAYYFLGDAEQARVNLREALARNPANYEAHLYMAATAARGGERETALWHAEEARALQPGFAARAWLESYPLADARSRDELRARLESLGL